MVCSITVVLLILLALSNHLSQNSNHYLVKLNGTDCIMLPNVWCIRAVVTLVRGKLILAYALIENILYCFQAKNFIYIFPIFTDNSFIYTGTTGPKASAAPGERDRNLPGAQGTVRSVFRRADPAVHYQLHREGIAAAQSEG